MEKNARWNLKEAIENRANEVRQPVPLAIWLGGNPREKAIVDLIGALSTFGWVYVDNHTKTEIKGEEFVVVEINGVLSLCPSSNDGFSFNPIMHLPGVRPFISQETVGGFVHKTRHAIAEDRFARFNKTHDPVHDGRILISLFEVDDLAWTAQVI